MSRFIKQARIENYSEATVKNYASALKMFLQYVAKLQVDKISDDDIQDYLYHCKREKACSYFSSQKGTRKGCGYGLVLGFNNNI